MNSALLEAKRDRESSDEMGHRIISKAKYGMQLPQPGAIYTVDSVPIYVRVLYRNALYVGLRAASSLTCDKCKNLCGMEASLWAPLNLSVVISFEVEYDHRSEGHTCTWLGMEIPTTNDVGAVMKRIKRSREQFIHLVLGAFELFEKHPKVKVTQDGAGLSKHGKHSAIDWIINSNNFVRDLGFCIKRISESPMQTPGAGPRLPIIFHLAQVGLPHLYIKDFDKHGAYREMSSLASWHKDWFMEHGQKVTGGDDCFRNQVFVKMSEWPGANSLH